MSISSMLEQFRLFLPFQSADSRKVLATGPLELIRDTYPTRSFPL